MGNLNCPSCGEKIRDEAGVSACPACLRPLSVDKLREIKVLEEKYAGYNAVIEYEKLKNNKALEEKYAGYNAVIEYEKSKNNKGQECLAV